VGTLNITANKSTDTRFADLGDPDAHGYPHVFVQTAFDNGITYGTNAAQSLFAPWNFIRRDQVVSMIVRGAANLFPGVLETPPAGAQSLFGEVPEPHGANLRVAEHNSLLNDLIGLGPNWSVTQNATRGEVAQMLFNLLRKIKESQVWVNADGSGDYPTIEAAVASVAPGTTIHLGPGVFTLGQTLDVERPVKLVGMGITAPNHTQVTCRHGVMHVGPVDFYAEGIDFVSTGSNERIDVVTATDATINLEDCRVAGGVRYQDGLGCGFHVSGTTSATVEHCIFALNGLNGITVEDHSQLTAESCQMVSNHQTGVVFYSDSSGVVRSSICSSNGYGGLSAQANTHVTFEDNQCAQNASSGIGLFTNAVGTVRGNICTDGPNCGISFWGNSSGTAVDNECTRNQWGLYVQATATPAIGTNNLHGNTYDFLDERLK